MVTVKHTCETCRAFHPTSGSNGQCRASPPVGVLDIDLAIFPRVKGDWWCMRHIPVTPANGVAEPIVEDPAMSEHCDAEAPNQDKDK